MELYKVPRNSRIKVVTEDKVPPGAPQIIEGEELNFRSIDGMYSYCTRDNGEVVHLAAWTDVELIYDKNTED
jgi:hypothetical protein